jgi:AcrR family transcriptional regulator
MARPGVYGGLAAEERTARRRARLLDAGLEVLGTRGWAQMSVRGVCREAQLTSRFFYESFDDLDALAVAVFDEVIATAGARMLEAVAAAPPDPATRAHAAIEAIVHELTDDPRRGRVACVEALSSTALARRRTAVMRDMTELISALGRETYRPPPEADALVEVTATVLAGGIAELLVAWLSGALDLDRDELVDHCAALFMATVEGAGRLTTRRSSR